MTCSPAKTAAFLAINPAGQTPALRCDDGSTLGEAAAIAEYLEELHPLPSLIGETPEQRVQTRQWWRRVELNITEFIHNAYHYSEGLSRFEPRIPVLPDAAAGLKTIAQNRLRWLDACSAPARIYAASGSALPTSGCMSGWILG